MGAALAYYIGLLLAPSVLILLAIAGFAFGAQAAEGRLVSEIQSFVGHEGAKAIQTMIEGARYSSKGIAATVLGLVTVFFAASAVVSELKDAMNKIPVRSGWHTYFCSWPTSAGRQTGGGDSRNQPRDVGGARGNHAVAGQLLHE